MDDSEKIRLMLQLAPRLKEEARGVREFGEKMKEKAGELPVDQVRELSRLGRELSEAYKGVAAIWEAVYIACNR